MKKLYAFLVIFVGLIGLSFQIYGANKSTKTQHGFDIKCIDKTKLESLEEFNLAVKAAECCGCTLFGSSEELALKRRFLVEQKGLDWERIEEFDRNRKIVEKFWSNQREYEGEVNRCAGVSFICMGAVPAIAAGLYLQPTVSVDRQVALMELATILGVTGEALKTRKFNKSSAVCSAISVVAARLGWKKLAICTANMNFFSTVFRLFWKKSVIMDSKTLQVLRSCNDCEEGMSQEMFPWNRAAYEYWKACYIAELKKTENQ